MTTACLNEYNDTYHKMILIAWRKLFSGFLLILLRFCIFLNLLIVVLRIVDPLIFTYLTMFKEFKAYCLNICYKFLIKTCKGNQNLNLIRNSFLEQYFILARKYIIVQFIVSLGVMVATNKKAPIP